MDKFQKKAWRLLKDNDITNVQQKNFQEYKNLIIFLSIHNVLEIYIKYRKDWLQNQQIKNNCFFINLHYAFRWASTKEGHRFWQDLTDEYDFEFNN